MRLWLTVGLDKPVILLKDVLCAVSMMNIPVEDEDTQRFVCDALGIACGQSGRVKETETTSCVFLCMMARRTDYGHGVSNLQDQTNNWGHLGTNSSSNVLVYCILRHVKFITYKNHKKTDLACEYGLYGVKAWPSSHQGTGVALVTDVDGVVIVPQSVQISGFHVLCTLNSAYVLRTSVREINRHEFNQMQCYISFTNQNNYLWKWLCVKMLITQMKCRFVCNFIHKCDHYLFTHLNVFHLWQSASSSSVAKRAGIRWQRDSRPNSSCREKIREILWGSSGWWL